MIYRGFNQSQLDEQYSPSSCVADIGLYLDEYARRSRVARDTLPFSTLRYGTSSAERIHFFPATRPAAPLHVFLHGGYWQQLSVEDAAFPAADMVRAGCAFAALGYGLAPAHDLDTIVAMVRKGLSWLTAHAGELGIADGAVHLSGHSAGAHLVAMAVLTGPWPDGRPAAEVVASATLLSGVYDLEPIRHSYVNAPLRLDAAAALRNSPVHQLRGCPPPVLVARGGQETAEFGRQHDEFVKALHDRGFPADELVVAHRNHFDLPYDLAAAETPLGDAVLATMTGAPV